MKNKKTTTKNTRIEKNEESKEKKKILFSFHRVVCGCEAKIVAVVVIILFINIKEIRKHPFILFLKIGSSNFSEDKMFS